MAPLGVTEREHRGGLQVVRIVERVQVDAAGRVVEDAVALDGVADTVIEPDAGADVVQDRVAGADGRCPDRVERGTGGDKDAIHFVMDVVLAGKVGADKVAAHRVVQGARAGDHDPVIVAGDDVARAGAQVADVV